ncbi:peptidoglycan-binding protein [Streptomyces hesseae]|uniref:Peptidoglycan-binding protein n=1 Tax=Streptomyces hesseae TaxID=3075519 RepID=A0ABU2STD1_9ACTN|nr:peptidoglycan-binding protein [Streptomyces sp. DSM 40473]MDT0451876.1 peptidoglycan-binding protein [Streptomyces sp. DSM 40473]
MTVALDVINTAREEVGYHEGREDGDWNNIQKYAPAVPGLEWAQGEAWCHTFVSWCFQEAGAVDLAPVTASCWEGVQWFQDRDRYTDYPVIGGIVYFGAGGGSHTGIVVAYTDDEITTVEGNTNSNGSAEGDGVYLKTRPRHSSYIHGYGIPDYPEGVVLADPEWRGRSGITFFGHEASTDDIPAGDEGADHGRDRGNSGFEPFPGEAWFRDAPNSPIITAMGRRLVEEGCSAYREGPGPQWTSADRESFRKWQRKIGDAPHECDGWPGPLQWAALKVPRTTA